ncbi:MAG: hypothetical protein AB1898_07445 [Acidobacteriota bacterium]
MTCTSEILVQNSPECQAVDCAVLGRTTCKSEHPDRVAVARYHSGIAI